jgi:zinc/manganese transport system substrate-binding protein
MPLRRILLGPVAAAVALALVACGATAAPPGRAGASGPTVVASTNVYGNIAEAVGGGHITVTSLITDPAADPHSYESTPAEAATVAGATIVIVNGGGYDDPVQALVAATSSAAGGTPRVLQVAALAPGATNEHFWYDLPLVQQVAGRLAADLGGADPAHAGEYVANAEVFSARVGELTERVRAIGAADPGARVAVNEPVADYLIATAGLTDATPPEFARAVEEDVDPPAAVVAQTLQLFTAEPVRALILNGQTRTATTDQVRQAAEAAGVPVVEVTETLPAGTDYLGWMSGQVDALAGALDGGEAP